MYCHYTLHIHKRLLKNDEDENLDTNQRLDKRYVYQIHLRDKVFFPWWWWWVNALAQQQCVQYYFEVPFRPISNNTIKYIWSDSISYLQIGLNNKSWRFTKEYTYGQNYTSSKIYKYTFVFLLHIQLFLGGLSFACWQRNITFYAYDCRCKILSGNTTLTLPWLLYNANTSNIIEGPNF